MNDLLNDLFIFEMANNHQGSVEHGLEIIRAMAKIARKHDIRAGVKFQYRDLDTLIHPDHRSGSSNKHIPRFLGTRLTRNDYLALVNAVRDEGMVTICTPFDEPSVGVILDHGIQIIKVASASANDWSLLEVIAKAHKPVICSTGGRSIDEIDNIVSFFTHRDVEFALLHCIGLYPAPNTALQLNFMDRMQRRYRNVPIGYSGHEDPDNLDVVKVAVAKGAVILERHVGVPTETIKLNAYSMNPEQTDRWVAAALTARKICGDDGITKHVSQAEIDSLLTLARGVYALNDIQAGEALGRHNVFFAMPHAEGQTTSGEFQEAMVASRAYRRNEPLFERRKPSVVSFIRNITHDVKGMLYEAHIEIGSDYEIELSHHYGIEHFRQTGALIVNVINREYCKKLVVVLPGQRHPNHRHQVKEETFQLLWGDLEITLGDKLHRMKPGDQLLVERGAWHSFHSRNGAIIEEISTTHIKGDSYYEDKAISSKDPIERKTVIESW